MRKRNHTLLIATVFALLVFAGCNLLGGDDDLTAVDTNTAPTFNTGSMNTFVSVGRVYTDTLSAYDAQDDELTFQLVKYPTGMILTDSIITWTPSNAGTDTVIARVSDSKGESDTTEWLVTVLSAPPTLTASVTADSTIVLSWTEWEDAYLYDLYYAQGTTVSLTSTKVNDIYVKSDTFTTTTLTYGQTYTFAVLAEGTASTDYENSDLSNKVTIEFVVGASSTHVIDSISYAINVADTSLIIDWTPLTGAGFYNLEYSKGTVLSTSSYGVMPGGDTTQVTFYDKYSKTYSTSRTLQLDSTYTFSVKAYKDGSYYWSDTITVHFTLGDDTASSNTAPVFTSTIMTTTATAGTLYKDTLTATDADSDPLTYTLIDYPTGMSISGAVLSWTPSAAGSDTISAKVSDGNGGYDTLEWIITVNSSGNEVADSGTTIAKAYVTGYNNADTTKEFTIAAGETIYLKSNLDANNYVYVFKSTGSSLLMKLVSPNNDTIGYSRDLGQRFESDEAGEYLLIIKNTNVTSVTSKFMLYRDTYGGSTGLITTPGSRFLPEAISLSDSSTGIISGTIPQNRAFYYTADVTAGDTIALYFNNSNSSSYARAVKFHKASDFSVIQEMSFNNPYSTPADILRDTLIADYTGTLMIEVQGFVTSTTVPFYLQYYYGSVQGSSGNTIDTVTDLPTDETVINATFTAGAGEYDYFAFDYEDGDSVTVYLYSSSLQLRLDYDTTPNTFAANAGYYPNDTAVIGRRFSGSGTMYVLIEGMYDNSEGPYSIWAQKYTTVSSSSETEPNDTSSTADGVTTDSTIYSAAINPAEDKDWYSFNAVSGTTYIINAGNGNIDLAIVLYDSDSLTILDEVDNELSTGTETLAFTCTTSGTYFVKAKNWWEFSTETGSYTFWVYEQ